jgi:hypothetical protein
MRDAPKLERRDEKGLADCLRARIAGYLPAWRPGERGADAALLAVAARFCSVLGTRLNQSPVKNLMAFLETAGIQRIPAQSARAPVVFKVNPAAADGHLPQGTRVAAPPPPGSSDQIVFETETDIALAAAQLCEVASVHPGRDQFADHSAAHLAGSPFEIFAGLHSTEHVFYLGHERVLNLAGDVTLKVSFELAANSSERLDIRWEYWDGQVWRPFESVLEKCDEEALQDLDGTNGLTRSGAITLKVGCAETKPLAVNDVETFWVRGKLLEPLPADPTQVLPLVEGVRLQTVITRPLLKAGLLPDKAFAGTAPLDVTQTFYPLGQQPQPGSVFYFTNEELFSKPKARAQVLLKAADTPQDDLGIEAGQVEEGKEQLSEEDGLEHSVVWEYWNGRDWVGFVPSPVIPPMGSNAQADFERDGLFTFDVPEDMAPLKVNDEEARWMRVRLVSGGYGFTATVAWSDANTTPNSPNKFTYVVSQPPALADFRLGYTWESAQEPPEATLAYNDFGYQDFTAQARYPGRTFLPFSRMNDTTPALYLGFDGKLPVDFVSLLLDVEEQRGDEQGPELLWEYWDGGAWRRVAVQDETGHLARPGTLALIGAADAVLLARFGTARHWLRARLREDGPPPRKLFRAIYLNAVWANQRQTVRDETLGQSSGLPNQFFQLNQFPVLAGEMIQVRELAGPLAEIEYPILRDELGQDRLRAVTDRHGKVTEVWVRWESQPHLFFSGAEDRHYVVNRAEGRLYFGDGVHGKIPPAKGLILAREYRAGGGKAGNVCQGAINQALTGVAVVQEVFNPLPAEGGTDAEPITAIVQRGPRTLRHRGRAMAGRDYEVMAREASPEVAWVRVFPASDPYLGRRPGHVLVMVLPETTDRRPWPSFGLRERVRQYLETHALAGLCSARCIHVSGPEYFPIDVEVSVVPRIASQAGTVEQRVRAALETFLHPLHGGPHDDGWELGRDVFLSDVAAVVEKVPGVDFAREIGLLREDTPQGERIPVPRDRLVMAGTIRIKMLLDGVREMP